MYGSESWAVRKRRIQVNEVRILWKVNVYTLRDHIQSEDIRSELNIFSMTENFEKSREEWIQHIQRTADGHLLKQLFKCYREEVVKQEEALRLFH